MSSDRKLLEMAAKAAGVGPILRYETKRNSLGIGPRVHYRLWDPLNDYSAALKIAMQLGICIQFIPETGNVLVYQQREFTAEPFNIHFADLGDIETRRCIVEAAAEIGKAMP